MSYEKAKEIRGKNLVPGLLTYYKNPVFVHQVSWIERIPYNVLFLLYIAFSDCLC